MNYQVLESENVWKYVFTGDDFVLESVLYRYGSFEKRTVICCSVQSGCPVGCTFCGTGANFIKNIDTDTIVEQVMVVIADKQINVAKCKKFQIMFMSMGEPFLNYSAVKDAIIKLHEMYPNAELLVSTIGLNYRSFLHFVDLSERIDKLGLQFSIHRSSDEERNKIIPYKNKWNLRMIRDMGMLWNRVTNRPVYLNYIVEESNSKDKDAERLKNLFSPLVFRFTFSVLCNTNKDSSNEKNLLNIKRFQQKFAEYNTRIFDPAGQDDIGGGCGQLWFVQDYLTRRKQ